MLCDPLYPHAVNLHLANVFATSRICFRKKHSFESHASPTSSVLRLQHAPSQRQWSPHSCQQQSHAWLLGEPGEGDGHDESSSPGMSNQRFSRIWVLSWLHKIFISLLQSIAYCQYLSPSGPATSTKPHAAGPTSSPSYASRHPIFPRSSQHDLCPRWCPHRASHHHSATN